MLNPHRNSLVTRNSTELYAICCVIISSLARSPHSPSERSPAERALGVEIRTRSYEACFLTPPPVACLHAASEIHSAVTLYGQKQGNSTPILCSHSGVVMLGGAGYPGAGEGQAASEGGGGAWYGEGACWLC